MHDEEDLALLEVRDLLFARLLQYRAFKHVAVMFAELEAAALRSYPRAVALEERYAELLPEVMLGVDAESFAQIAATAFTPRPVPTVGTRAPAPAGGVGARTGRQSAGTAGERAASGSGRRSAELVADCGAPIEIVGPVPGAARAVPGQGGSIRPIRTAWCAAGFVDRRTADQRAPGNAAVEETDS